MNLYEYFLKLLVHDVILPLLCLLSTVCRNRKDCGYSNDGWNPPELSPREPSDIQCEEHVEMESVKYGDRVRQLQNRQVRIKTDFCINHHGRKITVLMIILYIR